MMTCPTELDLARAISEGSDAVVAAHLASCAACRDAWDGATRAISLARQVPVPMPRAERSEETRTALLAASLSAGRPLARAPRSHRRAAWIGGAAMAAAATIAIVVIARPTAVDSHAHGTIAAHPNASYVASSLAPDEIVMLYDGTIDVHVAPLHRGERFRVILADAVIEVHGTAFVATARTGHLVSLDVTHGIVEVRAAGSMGKRLVAGESWVAPKRTDVATMLPPAQPIAPQMISPPIARSPVPPPIDTARRARPAAIPASGTGAEPTAVAPPARVPEEVAYDDGWTAMRAGNFARAATAFALVQVLDPGGRLAEDAGYWYAVALARAGQTSQAQTAFGDFIAAFPNARRVGEASAMLGWLLVDANDRAGAERRFRAAIADPSPAIRDSATAGLDAVAKMK